MLSVLRAVAALVALRNQRMAAREAKKKAEAEAWRAAQAARHPCQKRKGPAKANATRKGCPLCGLIDHQPIEEVKEVSLLWKVMNLCR